VDLAQSIASERFAANACLGSYRSTSRPVVTLTREQVERQAIAGTVLRCLTAVHWTSQDLGPPWRDAADGTRQEFLKKRTKPLAGRDHRLASQAYNPPWRGRTLPLLEVYLSWLETSWRALEGRVVA
jgi:hypothetical protein